MNIFNKRETRSEKPKSPAKIVEEASMVLFQPEEVSSPEDYQIYCHFYGLSPINLTDLNMMMPPNLRQ